MIKTQVSMLRRSEWIVRLRKRKKTKKSCGSKVRCYGLRLAQNSQIGQMLEFFEDY